MRHSLRLISDPNGQGEVSAFLVVWLQHLLEQPGSNPGMVIHL